MLQSQKAISFSYATTKCTKPLFLITLPVLLFLLFSLIVAQSIYHFSNVQYTFFINEEGGPCCQHFQMIVNRHSQVYALFFLRRLSLRFRTSVTTRNLSLVLASLGASSTSFRSGPGPHSFKRNSRILLSTSRLSLKRLDNLGILFASRRKVLYRSELGSQSLTVLKRSCVVICRFRRRSGLLVQAIKRNVRERKQAIIEWDQHCLEKISNRVQPFSLK